MLPIAKGVHADAHSLSELLLREANETSERGDVVTRVKFTLDEALAQPSGNGAGEVFVSEFWHVVSHRRCSR